MTNVHSNSAYLTLPVNLNGFEALEDESRKVLFVENLLLHEKLLPNYETLNLFERKKSTELSHTYRDIGNEHFRNRKFFSALCCYNKSLCFGNSPDVALTFANRSAIYLEIGEFELCLQNIQKARENNYPADKALKLEKREKLCTKKRVEKCLVKRNFLPRMKHAPNANYPFFIECLQLERNDEYGRHILTRDNLNAGDVIVDERPFCAMLLANCCYKRCSNCLAQYHLNLIPCPNCCSGEKERRSKYSLIEFMLFSYFFFIPAMFCSEKCLQSANKKFHRFECGISQSNFDLYFTKQTTIALRTFYEALNICGNSIEELKILFNESNCAEFTAFDLNIKDCNFKKMYFNVINSLCTNQEFRRSDDVLCRYATAIILHDFLIKHSSLKNIIESDVNKSFFIRAIFKLTQIAESNFHELYALAPNKERQMNEQFGIGCYGFASLLSHSCSPNVVRITFNGSNYIIATRKIYKGEQIFDNYG